MEYSRQNKKKKSKTGKGIQKEIKEVENMNEKQQIKELEDALRNLLEEQGNVDSFATEQACILLKHPLKDDSCYCGERKTKE